MPMAWDPTSVEISVRMLSGRQITARTSSRHRVGDVKQEISEAIGVDCNVQLLLYSNKVLQDHTFLAEYGIGAGAELQLVVVKDVVEEALDVQQLLDDGMPACLHGRVSEQDWDRFVVLARGRKRHIDYCICFGLLAIFLAIFGAWLMLPDYFWLKVWLLVLQASIPPLAMALDPLGRRAEAAGISQLAAKHLADAGVGFSTANVLNQGYNSDGDVQSTHTHKVVIRQYSGLPTSPQRGDDA